MRAHYHSDDEEKEIRKKFSDKTEHPKILIVTQKLLTGFRRADPLLHLPRQTDA